MSTQSSGKKYRATATTSGTILIAFSISYQPENLLARGMGLEHLRELLVRLARPLLRHEGTSFVYGGHWEEKDDNFTFEFLRLISAEQADNNSDITNSTLRIGKLYNHSAWPAYLDITPGIEARWINSCRIIRITQQDAGIRPEDVVKDSDARNREPRTLFNAAVTLSAMRRVATNGMTIPITDAPPEVVPPIAARILLGGKVKLYSGFLPGIFEEALLTLQAGCPLYILGGFGGATEILARVMMASGNDRPPELTSPWHVNQNPPLAALLENANKQFPVPPGINLTEPSLESLFAFVQSARMDLAGTLKTGLDEAETRELMSTQDVATAIGLVRKGLAKQKNLTFLPA